MSTTREVPEFQVFKTVLLYCMAIIALPVISFFTSKIFVFDGVLELSNIASNVYSAAVAVLVLHVALAAFIYRAYFGDQSKAQTKQD